MKVIKEGVRYNPIYRCTCPVCSSELEYNLAEVHEKFYEYGYEGHIILCPVCNDLRNMYNTELQIQT